MVQRAALSIAPDMLETCDALLACCQQLFHREFRRGVEIHRLPYTVIADHGRGEGMEMGFIARRPLKARRIDDEEIAFSQP
jgi:hypothetical protein